MTCNGIMSCSVIDPPKFVATSLVYSSRMDKRSEEGRGKG